MLDAAASLTRLTRERHSCRAFLPDPVEHAVIEELLTLAQQAPSWCNTQPWHAYVTEGHATERFRSGLRTYVAAHPPAPDLPFPEHYEGAAQDRRRACATALYDSVGVARGDRAASAEQTLKNFDLFGAPHVAVLTTESHLGVYGTLDCGIYVAHLLLAAQSLGLATIAQAAIATASPFVREFFALDDARQVLCGISFGYEDVHHPANGFRTERAVLGQAATFIS